jgi:hypothetical protein
MFMIKNFLVRINQVLTCKTKTESCKRFGNHGLDVPIPKRSHGGTDTRPSPALLRLRRVGAISRFDKVTSMTDIIGTNGADSINVNVSDNTNISTGNGNNTEAANNSTVINTGNDIVAAGKEHSDDGNRALTSF